VTLIVGLGNPGKEYAQTRHNIGFMVLDAIAAKYSKTEISKTSFQGELFKSGSLLFLKPSTFMNLSGKSVQAVYNFYKVENVIVIHDDLDLAFGALRFKKGGGSGGHNGIKSIDEYIGANYLRVRMGIGKPLHKSQVASFVLEEFNKLEKEHLNDWIEHSVRATELLIHNELEYVASRYSLKRADA